MTATTNNRFPTTTFGNDNKQKQKPVSSPSPAGGTLAGGHSFGNDKKKEVVY